MATRWGFLSTANITAKVNTAINEADNNELVAIASRDIEKASAWIQKRTKNQHVSAYGSYEELFSDEKVDIIYIPLPSALKKSWAIQAAKQGKHILCDKPFTSAEEVKEIVEACRENRVVFMDNTMFVHNPRTKAISNIVASGELGTIGHISASFTFHLPSENTENVRLQKDLEPLGALGDVGWYSAKAILVATLFELPSRVFATGNYKNGVIYSLNAICWFKDSEKTASFYCGFDVSIGQNLIIAGSQKTLTVTDFVLPWNAEPGIFPDIPQGATFPIQLRDSGGKTETRNISSLKKQEVLLIEEFGKLVQKRKAGTPEEKEEEKWANESLFTQKLLDALNQSVLQNKVFDIVSSKI